MAIRELLAEELANSLHLERDYVRAIAKLPRGSLVRKLIRGRPYYYLAAREGTKVRFRYLGRNVDARKLARYREAKQYRVQYRSLLVKVRAQIRFLRKALRAKRAI